MYSLINVWREKKEYQDIKESLNYRSVATVTGLPLLPLATCAAALFEDFDRPFLLICPSEEEAQALYENLSPFLGCKVNYFPALELLPFEVYAYNIEVVARRIDIMGALAAREKLFVVTSTEAILRKVVPPREFLNNKIAVAKGGSYDIYQLSDSLGRSGYERSKMVEIPGAFSLRGSIMDIFPINFDLPVRIEFFGDEVESLRYFDPDDQLSREELDSLTILPARELPLSPQASATCRENLKKALDKAVDALKGKAKKEISDRFSPLLELLEQGIWDISMGQLLTMFYPEAGSLTDYLDDGMILISEPDRVNESAGEINEIRASRYFDLLESGRILPSFYDNFLSADELTAAVKEKKHLLFSSWR